MTREDDEKGDKMKVRQGTGTTAGFLTSPWCQGGSACGRGLEQAGGCGRELGRPAAPDTAPPVISCWSQSLEKYQ